MKNIKILEENVEEIIGELFENKEPEKILQNKKYKVDSISENRVVLVDEKGIGRVIPFLGNEHLKINDEIELPE